MNHFDNMNQIRTPKPTIFRPSYKIVSKKRQFLHKNGKKK